jgi:hypothetical protein
MGRLLSQANSINAVAPLYGYGGKKIFLSSGTFTSPLTGKIRVQCLGGGGSGSIANIIGLPGDYSRGGGGGGFAVKELSVSRGDSFSITVGAGGVAAGNPGAGVRGNGANGGTTSFGSVVSATGGLGGISSNAYGNATFLGGVGVGGDLNFAGGDGGRFIVNIGGATGCVASATMYGDGGNGGNMASGTGSRSASGGGAIGNANAPDLTGAVSDLDWGAGAGTGTRSTAYREPGAKRFEIWTANNLYPATSAESVLVARQLINHIYPLDGGGGGGSGSSPNVLAGPGGGGSGQILTADGAAFGAAGICGGGGGLVLDFSSSSNYSGGWSWVGGGGGAALLAAASSGQTSGAGGQGLVIVEW